MTAKATSMSEQQYSNNIESALHRIREDIRAYACCDVTIVAASKFRNKDELRAAYDAGIRHFGENKGQEVRDKAGFFNAYDDIHLSFIGRIQKNKVKYMTGTVDMIQSVDSPEIAEYINSKYASENKNIDVLVEINSSGEANKGGIEPENVKMMLRYIENCSNMKLRGIMTLGPLTDDVSRTEKSFRLMKGIYDEYSKEFAGFDYLSMGMTDDYVTALKCGSNMIRIGRLLFGDRA